MANESNPVADLLREFTKVRVEPLNKPACATCKALGRAMTGVGDSVAGLLEQKGAPPLQNIEKLRKKVQAIHTGLQKCPGSPGNGECGLSVADQRKAFNS